MMSSGPLQKNNNAAITYTFRTIVHITVQFIFVYIYFCISNSVFTHYESI